MQFVQLDEIESEAPAATEIIESLRAEVIVTEPPARAFMVICSYEEPENRAGPLTENVDVAYAPVKVTVLVPLTVKVMPKTKEFTLY